MFGPTKVRQPVASHTRSVSEMKRAPAAVASWRSQSFDANRLGSSPIRVRGGSAEPTRKNCFSSTSRSAGLQSGTGPITTTCSTPSRKSDRMVSANDVAKSAWPR